MNTKETTELLRFAARLGNAVDKTIEDNKVTATDIQYLLIRCLQQEQPLLDLI